MNRPIQMCNDNGGWKPISTAPMDGTVIELKNNYGLVPTYSLSKRVENSWQNAKDPSSSIMDHPSHQWREYNGDESSYVDPTGGMQNDVNYWRAAVAVRHPALAPKMRRLMDGKSASEDCTKKGFFARLFS